MVSCRTGEQRGGRRRNRRIDAVADGQVVAQGDGAVNASKRFRAGTSRQASHDLPWAPPLDLEVFGWVRPRFDFRSPPNCPIDRLDPG